MLCHQQFLYNVSKYFFFFKKGVIKSSYFKGFSKKIMFYSPCHHNRNAFLLMRLCGDISLVRFFSIVAAMLDHPKIEWPQNQLSLPHKFLYPAVFVYQPCIIQLPSIFSKWNSHDTTHVWLTHRLCILISNHQDDPLNVIKLHICDRSAREYKSKNMVWHRIHSWNVDITDGWHAHPDDKLFSFC